MPFSKDKVIISLKAGTVMIEIADSAEQNTTADEKKKELFLMQKGTLDTFLERGAISKAQYDKSYGDLKRLMGFEDLE